MSEKIKKWIRMELPYACFAIVIENGVCVEAPPIAKWMMGRKYENICAWVNIRNGSILEME